MSIVKNVYPELPVIPYKKTSVEMGEVITYLKTLTVDKAVKIATYIIFRNESANGKSGVNDNYAGVQADNSRWPDIWTSKIVATTVKNENMTGNSRRFVVFHSWKDSVDFLVDRVHSRGLYVGGITSKITKMTVTNSTDFARAYYKEWVTGSAKAEPDKDTTAGLLSMYRQGQSIFQ